MLLRALSLTVSCWLLCSAAGQAQGDLTALSDPFDDNGRLKEWKRLAQEEGFPAMLKDIGLYSETGCLHLEPTTSLWQSDFRGPFLFKEVEGDFVLTTRLFLRGKRFATPATRWSLGGLLARQASNVTAETWVPGQENWVSLMVGSGSTVKKFGVEVRSTVQSETSVSWTPLGKNWTWAELRMVRMGSTFLFLMRPEGMPWRVVARESRPDLPSRLQLGLTACDDWMSALRFHRDPAAFNAGAARGNPDLEVLFDSVDFAKPARPEGLDVDWTSPDVSDERILELFAD